MDPHIFADPDSDPESQNLADPTDPDPKHWQISFIIELNGIVLNQTYHSINSENLCESDM